MDLFLAVVFIGLVSLFLLLCISRVLLPVQGAWIVIVAKEDGCDLEQKCQALLWLQSLGFLCCPICLLNQGLSESGLKLVEQLEKRWPEITIWEDWDSPKKSNEN